jgi:hypothetical protein
VEVHAQWRCVRSGCTSHLPFTPHTSRLSPRVPPPYCVRTVSRFCPIFSSHAGADLPFSADALQLLHNSELADTLGNLIHRY